MKKLLLSMLGVLIALPGIARDFTYEYEGQTLIYTVLDEDAKTCETAYNDVSGDVVIPAIAKDGETEYSVTSIGNGSFYTRNGLTSVTIPDSVTSIGENAFDGCSQLVSVILGNSVTSIGRRAFDNCQTLTSIEFPNCIISIGDWAFACCYKLTSVEIPDSVTSLGNSAFWSCSELTSVTIGNSLTSIEDSTFYCCGKLTSVTIGNSVTSIGKEAFNVCKSLPSIEIPASVTSIGANAFDSCHSLRSVNLPEGLKSLGKECFRACIAVTSINIPEGIETLGDGCFNYLYSLTEIVFPESLKTIGDRCFEECPLTAVRFGSNIERIGSNAFSTISQFEVNDKLVSLGDKAFGDNFRLLKINRDTPPQLLSANMGYTEDVAYNILVIVPANGDDVYNKDPKWKGFHIVETAPTKTVFMTGDYPLSEEIATTTQQMPGKVTSLAIVGPLADDDWKIIKQNLLSCYDLDLSGVTNTEIPAEVFADNMHMLSLKLPSGLKAIGRNAFKGSANLKINELPECLETIGDSAFEGCTMFDVDALPASLKYIGAKAFADCRRLQLTELPAIESIGTEAFSNCPRFMSIDMSATALTVISRGAFANCVHLRDVTLPETLTAIEPKAFENTSVNFIEFPAGMQRIGDEAFRNTPVISVEFPRGVETIENGTFAECPKIKSVSFSSRTTGVGNEAFLDCRGIKSISVPCAVPPTVGSKTFNNVRYRDVVVSIPTMKYREYLNALGWGSFTQLSNSIFMPYEEVNENGDAISEDEAAEENIEIGTVENGTYDEIVENIISEEEQAAEDVERDILLFLEEIIDTPEEVAARMKRARAAARAEAEATADIKARKAFSRLYSGQSMTIGDNSGYRVKIQPKEGVEIAKIEFGGKDITNTYIDGIVMLPMLYSTKSLKVYRKMTTTTGMNTIGTTDRTATADVYTLQGIVVLRDATEAQVRGLAPGLYIYKGRKIAIQ